MTDKWALYDIFVDDVLAYVGTTNRPAARLSQHKTAGTVPYFAEMRIVQWFGSQSEALLAERKRIKEMKPPRNVKDAGSYPRWIGHEDWVVRL